MFLGVVLSSTGWGSAVFWYSALINVFFWMCLGMVRSPKFDCIDLDSRSRTKEWRRVALDPVWPHVLDRWCAGLVSSVILLTSFVGVTQLWDHMRSLTFIFRGWFNVNRPKRQFACPGSNMHLGMGHLLRWWSILLCLSFLHRGEALNPGPFEDEVKRGDRSWSMGTFNPSGLGGKHQVLSSYLNNGDLWAVTETHLTSQGLRSFRQGLKWSDSEFSHCIGGHPVPLRSHSCATGSWNGVAVISKSPTRAVPVAWSDHVFETSRVQLARSYVV